ncbi:hypothetical protein Y919_11005 [Caloranaerobacter azorensis H53214]|uniref:Uncharacterized protein n=1 Tax=Caloranaerobacter azorensis H53214 TaxID=1156417 RepID=A0A096BFX9_9FIRM|nr:hypothetical protein [Caloranaerobacter azorensis]KGG79618.1 hypothetical protein Y919_11005 [Caloranaerobacter azorensis H53214]
MKYNESGYVIRISERVLIQMCLSGLEAYCIFHKESGKKKNKLETYGQIWGHEVRLPNNRVLYCIEMLTIDTSAVRGKDFVECNEDALMLKRDIMTSFWPQYDFLGDFHTHPYNHYKEVLDNKWYEFSEGDYESIENWSDYWKKHNYRVGIVLSIANMKRSSSKEPSWIDNSTIEFTLGNYRFWIKGYVSYQDEKGNLKLTKHDDKNVILDCPSIVGLIGDYCDFGRVIDERGLKHKCGSI